MKMRGKLKLVFVFLYTFMLKQSVRGNTAPPDTTSTTDGTTTTATPGTTTTSTTTPAPTTTTEDPTTTATDGTTTTTTEPPPLTSCGTASNGLFLPHGAAVGDTQITGGDNLCHTPPVRTNDYDIPFQNNCFRKFHICINGLVCFQSPWPQTSIPNNGQTVPGNRYCMAPFFMDLTTASTGSVWFHEYDVTEDCSLKTSQAVTKAQELVATENQQPASNFLPVYVLVVTWDGVPRSGGAESETVTYQVILASDGTSTYYFYVYKDGGMGITAGDVFIGILKSGLAQGLFGSIVDDNFYRTADQSLSWTNGGCKGARAFTSTGLSCGGDTLTCLNWHSCEVPAKAQYMQKFAGFEDCPCTLTQASAGGTGFDYPGDAYLSTLNNGDVASITSTTASDDGKTCSYRKRENRFTFVRAGRDAGSYATANPIEFPAQHQQNDIAFREACCNAGLCTKYFNVRPRSDECQLTQTSTQTSGGGDPHIVTLDGYEYTFNGLGEYLLLNMESAGFKIQARTGQVISSGNGDLLPATIFTAFVAKGAGFWVQVELNSDRSSIAIYAGTDKTRDKHRDYTNEFYEKGDDFKASAPVSLKRIGETLKAELPVTSQIGITMSVTNANGVLQLSLSLNNLLKNTLTGLLGNFDDNPNNDLIPRNTLTAIPSTSSEETIFNNFGQTWLTSAAESEFYYRPGKTHDSYKAPDFVPVFADFSVDELAAANAVCGDSNNKECIYDFIVSKDATLALGTLQTFELLAQQKLIANNLIPNLSVLSGANEISGESYLYATVDVENTLQVQATDDGTVTTALTSDIPGLQQTTNADGSLKAVFTLRNLNQVSLSYLATDNLEEVSPQLVVIVVVCSGCNSHGTCDFTNFQEASPVVDGFKVAVCNCQPYWEGDHCENDFNGCADLPCFEGQECADTLATANAEAPELAPFTCGACPSGYTKTPTTCEDINECSGTNPCTDGTCVNTVGSFQCECNSGFRLVTDMVTCIDINECDESTDNCDQVCTNTAGSFTCSCNTGYKRNTGNTACEIDATNTEVANKCQAAGCDTADGCTVDDDGNAACFCNTGYTLDTNDNKCSDTDECDTQGETKGVCSQVCTNTVGTYTCSCYPGFLLDADKVTCNACTYPSYGVNCAKDTSRCEIQHATYDTVRGCVCNPGWEGSICNTDVNECLDESICGDVNKECINTGGSYTCPCREGYQEQDDKSCADIDECADIGNACEQTCTNTIGSFICGCESGYNVDTTDTTKCVDINECTSSTSGCEQTCFNIIGGFNCECNPGFELNQDGKTCKKLADEDVCRGLDTKTCSDICTVENGAPVCSCNNGYVLGSDDQTCIDVNECDNDALNLCSVKSSCVNTAGGYTCSCAAGFRLENDQRTCTACDAQTYGVNCANSCDCGAGADRCDSVTGCVCKTGYTGEKCAEDKDECQTAVTALCTAANEICVNIPGSYECRCNSGYKQDGNGNCVNINECDDSTLNTCSQVCTDTDGSFTCSCNPGFVQDGNNCNDINECEGVHECGQTCTNVVGSYRCSCSDNFQLNEDKKTCTAINVCDNPNSCTGGAVCAKVENVDTCSCQTGYAFDTGSTTNCIDIKECDSNLNSCDQKCIEEAGGYSCECNQDGYKLDIDQQTCKECEEGKYGDDCSLDCACETSNHNTKSCDKADGTCTCNSGWEGPTCATNINECLVLENPCQANSACVDTDGSYTCTCSLGYVQAGGDTCSECDTTHYGYQCSKTCSCVAANTEDCNDVDGACTCKSGWNGPTCSDDINECLTANICNDNLKTCTDKDGSYQCSCISGYTLNSENNCIDNNECLLGTDTCDGDGETCENVAPGFTCKCEPGYSTTGLTCTPCSGDKWGEQCNNDCDCNATNSNRCDPATGCVCKQGWTGINCNQDIDECTLGTSDCVANSVCTNTPGSFSCACRIGYASSNDQCVACSNNGHGASCSTPCDCIVAHTITPTQSCNRINGHCICKAGWEGDRCETDVDECDADNTLCTDIPNQGCHNLNGSYVCSCDVGYERQEGNCVPITATTTIAVPAGDTSVDMYTRFNLSVAAVSKSHDLDVSRTNDEYKEEAQNELTLFFSKQMENNNFKSVKVYAANESSLNVYYKVIIADTDAARRDFANATHALLTAVIPLFNQNTVVQELRIGNTNVNPQVDSEKSIKCSALEEANGKCTGDEECVLEDSVPVCRDKSSDNFALILGLGVGIPLFLTAVLIIALCVMYLAKRKRRHRHVHRSREFDRQTFDGSGFFPTAMPTKINTFGRNDPVYVPYSWDDESTVTRSSSDDVHRKRRRRRRGETYPAIDIEPTDYDNRGAQNFSWDFMYSYLGPDEKYEIQRPHLERR